MDSFKDVVEENRRLRRTMRDLVALSTLPAVWFGLPVDGIARGLADVLLSTLSLDLVYVRLSPLRGRTTEVARSRQPRNVGVDEVRALLNQALSADPTTQPVVVANAFDTGSLYLAVTRFGVGEEHGVLITGSRNPSFPTETDRLLLGVGANQTAIVLQRRRAEDQTQEQRERLLVTLASIGDAVLTTDTGGRITFLNPVAESLTGWTLDEAIGQPMAVVFDIINEGTRQPAENPVSKVLRDGKIVGLANHTVLIAKDGTERPIDDSAAPIRDSGGEIVGCVLVFRDISETKRVQAEQRKADERLREAEAQFRAMADNIPQLSWMATADGALFWFNRRWYEYTGTTLEQVQGDGWHGVVSGEDLPRVVDSFTCCIRSGQPWEDTFALRRHDGAFRWHLSRAMPITNEDGVVLRWFGSNTDITEQRKMAADLAEADRRKNEFLATLAHELRNPLAPIRNGLQVLKLRDDDERAAEQARSMMDRQLSHLVRLVDDLMDVSRITSGKIELRREPLQLAAVVHSAVETSRPLIEQMGHELDVQLPEQPIAVSADFTRLAQVFMNLLNNAAKYSERGGHIQLIAERSGTDLVVSVKDHGIGIAAEHLPHVFDMFSQVDRSLERSQGGLGIGLTLVKRLIELHGGTIDARSAGPNQGSEFVVRLPIVIETATPRPTSAALDRPRESPLRILVVDDNRDGADLLALMLESMGNEVRVAYDGEQAVVDAAEFRSDVVLLDIGLPKLDGHEVCRRIRKQPGGNQIIMIAQTGWGQVEDRQRTREAGFDHHMVKPLDPHALRKLLAGIQRRGRV
jgi:PAS domain S-box-containing protein